ncbi:MAG: DUF4358 domain-containing protein [Oscillospiraceae bacterium]
MKKYISAAAIAAILLTFAGCSSSDNSSVTASDNQTSSTVEESTSAATESSTTAETTTESSAEDTQPVESEPEETKPVETQPEESVPEETKPVETQPEESVPEETQPEETKPVETQPVETKPAETQPVETKPEETKPVESEPEETKPVESEPEETKPVESEPEESVPEQSESKCDKLANAAMEAISFPAMGIFDDAEAIQSYYSIDVSLCDDFAFYINMMSVHLNEVIVLKPTAGNENTLTEQIKAHLEYQKENGIWYPAQEESVAGAVWGVTPGGYIYLVIHADGQSAADAIIAAE